MDSVEGERVDVGWVGIEREYVRRETELWWSGLGSRWMVGIQG